MRAKRILALLMPLAFLGLYLSALVMADTPAAFIACYTGMGIVSVLMFINLIHDGVHNHIFKKEVHNQAYLLLFDLIGGNSFIWKKRHLLLHHKFPNVAGFDADIEQSGPVKIFPHLKTNPIHRYQHLFVFLLYPLFLFNWIFIRDFRDFFSKKRLIRKFCKIPVWEYVKLFFFKGLFFGYIILLPIFLGVPVAQVFIGLGLLLFVGSVVAMLSLLTPHANSANSFPVADTRGRLPITWLEHQFNTTNDLKADTWFTRNLMGNFNYHLAHHLFPQVHSAYAREVTECIQQFAISQGFPYKKYSLGTCLKLHYKLIRQNAGILEIFEEDM
jgi:linoleoyl-CoA desaturase